MKRLMIDENCMMFEYPWGDWVSWEDTEELRKENARLKELSREMLEALTMVYKNYHNDMSIYDLTQVHDAIAKAEGREPIREEEEGE